MKSRRIVVVGNSHVQSLTNAIAKNAEFNNLFDVYWLKVGKAGLKNGDLAVEDARALVKDLNDNDILVFSLLGTVHNSLNLFEHDVPFDFHYSHFDVDINRCIIPKQVIVETIISLSQGMLSLIRDIMGNTKCRVYNLPPPPPKDADEMITNFVARKGRLDFKVAPATFRLKMWQLECDVVNELATEESICNLGIPDIVRSKDGFLEPNYYQMDSTHANFKYGNIILKNLTKVYDGE
ncbi:MAG: hypothetical protein ABJH28_03225 [Paraglaciecola sp.]|uniref:hypothetical protein n=1 Tax=Paraglaciecola sp. TaxID=1920173 RepID=UPI0032634DF2